MKKILYTLCFFFLCVIDQRVKTCSGIDGWLETFSNLTGVVMAVLIMSHYKIRDFVKWKIPYLVWSVLSVVGGITAFWIGTEHHFLWNEMLSIIVPIILFGYIIIHIFIDIVMEKHIPKLNKKFTLLWCIMMALMVFSRSEYLWPFCYFVMFLCFALTPYTEQEQKDMIHGVLNGIILGFFIMQGFCFVFRPYDAVRYTGIYSNPNLNALFYLEVLAAMLTKLVYTFQKRGKWWVKTFYFLGCGSVLSFLFLSIGRTAWITAFFLVLAGLWSLGRICGKKSFIRHGAIILLCTCITFPLCFGAIRYIPPYFHHPVWFWGEWEESRVHSWDPWDSEKYVELDEFIDVAIGRILSTLRDLQKHSLIVAKAESLSADLTNDIIDIPADIVTEVSEVIDNRYDNAVFKDPDIVSDSVLTRGTIYQYYFTHLTLFGQPYSEQGFQLTPVYWIGHAHNIFLQYGTDFGIPVMILLGVLSVWAVIIFIRRILAGQEVEGSGYMLFIAVTILFGCLEYSWGTGSLSIFMLFFSWTRAMYTGQSTEETEQIATGVK